MNCRKGLQQMPIKIPESHRDLLRDDTRAFAVLGTQMEDGSPQVTPVWFDMEGDRFRINTARGRTKERNMLARPNVSLVILDPNDPYRYLMIRGRVVSSTEDGAREHIDRLAHKYRGTETYEWYKGEQRVLFYIEPLSVSTMG